MKTKKTKRRLRVKRNSQKLDSPNFVQDNRRTGKMIEALVESQQLGNFTKLLQKSLSNSAEFNPQTSRYWLKYVRSQVEKIEELLPEMK